MPLQLVSVKPSFHVDVGDTFPSGLRAGFLASPTLYGETFMAQYTLRLFFPGSVLLHHHSSLFFPFLFYNAFFLVRASLMQATLSFYSTVPAGTLYSKCLPSPFFFFLELRCGWCSCSPLLAPRSLCYIAELKRFEKGFVKTYANPSRRRAFSWPWA